LAESPRSKLIKPDNQSNTSWEPEKDFIVVICNRQSMFWEAEMD
jgi:hypothetical protein